MGKDKDQNKNKGEAAIKQERRTREPLHFGGEIHPAASIEQEADDESHSEIPTTHRMNAFGPTRGTQHSPQEFDFPNAHAIVDPGQNRYNAGSRLPQRGPVPETLSAYDAGNASQRGPVSDPYYAALCASVAEVRSKISQASILSQARGPRLLENDQNPSHTKLRDLVTASGMIYYLSGLREIVLMSQSYDTIPNCMCHSCFCF